MTRSSPHSPHGNAGRPKSAAHRAALRDATLRAWRELRHPRHDRRAREAARLRDDEGLTRRQVAQRLGMSMRSVTRYWRRADELQNRAACESSPATTPCEYSI